MEPILIMAERAGRPEHTPEAEPVLVALARDERGEVTTTLTLDDGETLSFVRSELVGAATADGAALADAA